MHPKTDLYRRRVAVGVRVIEDLSGGEHVACKLRQLGGGRRGPLEEIEPRRDHVARANRLHLPRGTRRLGVSFISAFHHGEFTRALRTLYTA